ncbi:protein-L-isoaspartate(D-aspartate) O-methyltransferase [candidate division KSB1 bacterium]|nr:protein-L-isoaspartate(D-aspartate) O-methyltransferase [candidate division KSB1 bacterium]
MTCLNSENKFTQDKPAGAASPFESARLKMVKNQIYNRGIRDSLVLKALRKVPRHLFVPIELQNQAYDDNPLPIGRAQTISQPYIVAFMTEQLNLNGSEKVLEIGTGSGYQAAILAEIVREVYSIEIIESLGIHAQQLLKSMGYQNIFIQVGDGYEGWPGKAPFDAIMVTAAPDHIPEPLLKQLKIGGRMILPVGDLWQELILIHKEPDGSIKKSSVLPVRFVPMRGKAEGLKN